MTTTNDVSPTPGSDVIATPVPEGRPARNVESRILGVLEPYGLLFLFAAVIVLFALLPSSGHLFFSLGNFTQIAGLQSVLALVALASIFPLIAGHFDLSVGAITGISCIASAAALAQYHVPIPVAMGIGVGLGAGIGALNGLLVTKAHINALIVTIGAQSVIAALVVWYTQGTPIQAGIPPEIVVLGNGQLFGVPLPVFYLAGVCVVLYYLLEHTPFGRRLYAVGISPSSARLVGITVDRVVLASFVASGAISGLAGVLLLARNGSALPTVGPNYLLPALAAAFLGATAFKPGVFNVQGTILAIFFVAVSVNGMQLAGISGWVEQLFEGLTLVAAVAIAAQVARRRSGTRRG
jgi:ribose transport system permease protein